MPADRIVVGFYSMPPSFRLVVVQYRSMEPREAISRSAMSARPALEWSSFSGSDGCPARDPGAHHVHGSATAGTARAPLSAAREVAQGLELLLVRELGPVGSLLVTSR